MAKELNAGIGVTGLTVTCTPYLAGVAQASISMSELGTVGLYQGDMTGAAGTYQLAFIAAGATRATGSIIWDGSAEVTANTVNVSKVAGTTQTARDIGASVIAASVTGLTASDVGAIKTTIGTAGAGLTALGDTRLGHLDADVSSRSTFAGGPVASVTGAVGSVAGLDASKLDVAVSTRLATAGYTAPDNASTTAIKAKTDLIPASPAAVGSAMTLTSAYDPAKTAATQTSVDDLPTNAELATALAGADDAVLAQVALVKAKTDQMTFTNGQVDATGLTQSDIRAALGMASADLDAQLDNIPAAVLGVVV